MAGGILITGAGGQLGRDVVDAAAEPRYEHLSVIAADRSMLDVTSERQVRYLVEELAPRAVIHCAAWTAVDAAEADRDGAYHVNEAGSRNVAKACAAADAHLVAVSTDMVFDGADPEGYDESAAPAPINVYGASKLAGERAIQEVLPEACIARTSWVFGAHGDNFVRTIANVARGRDAIDGVADQVGGPTWTRHLAHALLACARERTPGILHLAGAPIVTRAQWAEAIIAAAGFTCEVRPVGSDHFPLPARRQACSILRSTRADAPIVGDWRDGLAPTLAASSSARSV